MFRFVFQSLKVGPQFFQQLSKGLRLSAIQEVVLALVLRHSSTPELATLAQTHLRTCLPALVQSYIDTEGSTRQHEGGLHETTPEVLHLILSAILLSPKDVGLSTDTHEAFLRTLQRDFPKELVPVVLAPLLYPTESQLTPEMSSDGPGISGNMLENSLSELVAELGYSFTSNLEECRNSLLSLAGGGITPLSVAKVLSTMCRTHNSLDESLNLQTPGGFWSGNSSENKDKNSASSNQSSSWNVDIFVQALKEVSPNLPWSNVILELDHQEFLVKDRPGLVILMTALRLGLQNLGFHPDTFPIDHLYRRWKNIEGQFHLISITLKNPDIFCFADYPFHSVNVEVLKAPPESDNKEIATWRSLNLIEVLLHISECGFYPQTQELFKFPIQHCPDVLVLGLLQISPPVTMLRQELLTNLMPIFLGNHPNSAIILHHAWHAASINIKPIIMHAMAEWYIRGEHDQTRLSRILDVAQDLKALSMLLNAQSFPFIIDLACLASRREYLKLEKWLTDKIREHGETFVSACIKFLQRRCPQIVGGKTDESLSKAVQLPHETLTTMLLCLQNCVGSVSKECADAILTMVSNCSMLLKSRQAPPGVLRTHRGLETPFNPSSLSGPLFNAASVDPISTIGSNLANIGLGGSTNSAFNITGGLGPLVSSPGSPSRLISAGPSNSPFPMMPLPHSGPVGTGASLVPGVNAIGGLGRLGPTPSLEKPRAPDSNLFPEMAQNVSKEVEDEANSYFQRIYNHPPHPTLSIDEVLDMLKKFQDSPIKRERDVSNFQFIKAQCNLL